MITLNPYLVFNDNCEAAFKLYQLIFNADNLYLGRYKDVPEDSKQLFPNSAEEKIMHASLQISKNNTLMGCDNLAYFESSVEFKNKFYLYISIESREEADRIFYSLSAEGEIIMPMTQTFWANYYGMLTDKFGIHWKITSD